MTARQRGRRLRPLDEEGRRDLQIDDPKIGDTEREAWLKLSEESLTKAWDNPDDDVFNELLAK